MHLEKYKRGSVSGLMAHDERTIENHTNEKIDPSKSHLNYNLIEGMALENYNKRMSEVFCINRKDINTLASLAISLPVEVKDKDRELFFEKCLEHFKGKIGESNIVSAIVHMDETRPHIHIKFIPIYEQEKTITRGKDKGKTFIREAVSYDTVCDRKFYQTLHKDLQAYIDNQLGYHVGIENGKTKGVASIAALKELDSINEKIKAKEQQLEAINTVETHAPAITPLMDPIEKGIVNKEYYVPYEEYERKHEECEALASKYAALETQYNLEVYKNETLTTKLEEEVHRNVFKENRELVRENKQVKAELQATKEESKAKDKKIFQLEAKISGLEYSLNWYMDFYYTFTKHFAKLKEKGKEIIINWFNSAQKTAIYSTIQPPKPREEVIRDRIKELMEIKATITPFSWNHSDYVEEHMQLVEELNRITANKPNKQAEMEVDTQQNEGPSMEL